MKNAFLIGKATYLRTVEISDALLIQKWHNDPDIRKSARLGELPVTYAKEEYDINVSKKSGEEIYLMIVKKTTDKPIGFIRLNYIDNVSKNMWLRMIIGDVKARGRNLAEDALRRVLEWLFYEQNVHRISLETYETNKRAIRFFEKLGFKHEGIIRESVYVDDKYYNILSLGLLKREYKRR